MILKALVDYYEILSDAGKASKEGYNTVKVSHALELSRTGRLLGIVSIKLTVKHGKKNVEIPQVMTVPLQRKKSVNISANYLCATPSYVLGLDNKGKPDRTRNCFEAFKALHHEILDDVDDPTAVAILRFLDNWDIEKSEGCPLLQSEMEVLKKGGNLVFMIKNVGYAHEIKALTKAWDNHMASLDDSAAFMRCLVTGELAPIARLHPSIKGAGGQPSGTSVVSFNDRAYESYGREKDQGLNAPVSKYAAFAYSTALNYLLADRSHKQTIGDTSIVYWAQSTKSSDYQDVFSFALDPKLEVEKNVEEKVDADTERLLAGVFGKLVNGTPVSDVCETIDAETRFFILGVSPNAARLSIRFFVQDSFGKIIENVLQHFLDMEIEHFQNEPQYIPLWRVMQETVSPNSKDKVSSPLLSGAVLRAIFTGRSYPQALFQNVMRRIRAEKSINYGKVAIIKAFLIRNYQGKYKEEMTVAINKESNNKAYLLGRLFAVLEKAQQDANPGIDATIKDRYFTSACATPGSVFPTLLKLSAHHIAKAEYGYISEKRIGDLMGKMNLENHPFPAYLRLPDQGVFVLGYYHQVKENYRMKTEEDK